MQKRPLVIANWKIYIELPEDAKSWVAKVGRAKKDADVWVAMPAPFVPLFSKSSLPRGGQAVSAYEPVQSNSLQAGEGRHTGEVTAAMLKAVGASFSLVGHSERRSMEDNATVHAQFVASLKAGLTPVLCIGEHERSAEGTHFGYIEEQLRSAFAGAQSLAKKAVIAYEPVWAIGKTASAAMTPQELEETAIYIRKVLAELLGRPAALKIPILYGGSVEPVNAHSLLTQGGVNGFLVGHASVNPSSFIGILQACKE